MNATPHGMRGRDRKVIRRFTRCRVLCVIVPLHFWKFGLRGSEIFGDTKSGYIVNPPTILFAVSARRRLELGALAHQRCSRQIEGQGLARGTMRTANVRSAERSAANRGWCFIWPGRGVVGVVSKSPLTARVTCRASTVHFSSLPASVWEVSSVLVTESVLRYTR